MRSRGLCVRLAVFFYISLFNVYASGESFGIISPQENKLQNELTVNVVLDTNSQRFDSIKIVTAKKEFDVELGGERMTRCKNISLRLGENRLAVRAYKDKKLVDEQIRHVYVTSELYHQYKYPPKKYKRDYFHNAKNEKLCSKCHDMRVNEVEGVAFIDVTKSNCYLCHKNLTKEKYAHAPAVNYLCTSCHKQKDNIGHKYNIAQHVGELCFDCHLENQESWEDAKYRHEPLDSGNCDKCHNPHSSPNLMFLRKPVNKICMGCHKDKEIRAMQSKNSACKSSESKLCVDCHTPHATNQPFFLKKIVGEKR